VRNTVDVVITKATEADALLMSETLNATQVNLILSLGDDKSVQECVRRSVDGSPNAWSGRINGELVAMWGVYPLEETIGYPWMYSTAELGGRPKLALTIARRVVDEMLTVYPRLFGHVDKRFPASITFAQHLGFKVGEYTIDPFALSIERVAP
jgi:hypothetical protein